MVADGGGACLKQAREMDSPSKASACKLQMRIISSLLTLGCFVATAGAGQTMDYSEYRTVSWVEPELPGTFPAITGTRALFIPFIDATSVKALALGGNTDDGITTYVLYCPSSNTSCSLSPSMTITEGFATAAYTTTWPTGGFATVGCYLTTTAVCQVYGWNVPASVAPATETWGSTRTTTLSGLEYISNAVEVTSLVRVNVVTYTPNAAAPTARATQPLTVGAEAGIGIGAGFAAIFIIAAVSMFLRRRRKRRSADHQPYLDEKAELPGHRSPVPLPKKVELDQEAQVNEANGVAKPPEMDDRTTRAELDGSWHGHEAP